MTCTQKAMQVIGLNDNEQHEIFKMLAIILWLGNVQFVEGEDGNSSISDAGVTDFVAYLMEVDGGILQKALTSRVMETQRGGRRGSVYDVPLNPAQATSGRDALAKAVYNNLFEWIVSRINVSMKPRSAMAQVIGILVSPLTSLSAFSYIYHNTQDIFGFEIFEVCDTLTIVATQIIQLQHRTTRLNNFVSITLTKSCSKSSLN